MSPDPKDLTDQQDESVIHHLKLDQDDWDDFVICKLEKFGFMVCQVHLSLYGNFTMTERCKRFAVLDRHFNKVRKFGCDRRKVARFYDGKFLWKEDDL